MPNYNPYYGMPRGPGGGSSYSYGQQGRSRSALPSTSPGYDSQGSYQGSPGGGQRDIGSQNYWDRPNQGWGDQWSRDGGGGYPGQQQRMPQPPAGKGRGMGGIGGGAGGGFRGGRSPIQQFQQQRSSDIYGGNDPFQIYGDLMRQRGMEEQLGMEPGAAWSRPQGMQGWHMYEMFPGLFPEKGGY